MENKPVKCAVHVLPSPKRPKVHCCIKTISNMIDDETLAVAYVVLNKDRTFQTGIAYEPGLTFSDTLGAVEGLKQDMIEDWDDI